MTPSGADNAVGRGPRSAVSLYLSDTLFYVCLAILGGSYAVMILLLLLADVAYMVTSPDSSSLWGWLTVDNPMILALSKPEIRYSIKLSMISCTISAILSLWVAVPVGYLLSRHSFPGRNLIDVIFDIPIVLPPLVVGLSLLILFQFWPFITRFGDMLPVGEGWADTSLSRLTVFQIPSVILAQFMVAAAFAVRTMRATFDHIDPRHEHVALALGCSRAQAFGFVVLPEAWPGMLTAWTLAWARSLGEFGPLLIFAGATRNKTEVLSTTVFLEMSIGDLEAAVAVSLIMVATAVLVLVVTRLWGTRELSL